MTRRTHTKTTTRNRSSHKQEPITFLDHLRELQARLGWVAAAFLLASAIAYPFFNTLVNFLVRPLGDKNQLVYLTPGGAFGFVMQVCLYVGFIGALPVMLYHTYQFVIPAVKAAERKKVILYTAMSFVLALAGVLFAYYIVLPSALYFLTNFNLYHINPMLTIDSYLSFVMSYLITGALLFQLPLVLLVINTITPMKPSKLMGAQGYIILAAFIFGAVASPTSDVINQTLLALPIVVMYQLGILMIWLKNRSRAKRQSIARPIRAKAASPVLPQDSIDEILATFSQPAMSATVAPVIMPVQEPASPPVRRSLDGVRTVPRQPQPIARPAMRPIALQRPSRPVRRSLDGVYARA